MVNTNITLNNKTLKKLINVYQLKYKNGNAQGFGDYLRGCFCLLQISHKLGLQFEMNMTNHPISKFFVSSNNTNNNTNNNINYKEVLHYKDTNYVPTSPTSYNTNSDIFLQEFIQKLNSIKGTNYPLFCNSFPISSIISQEDKNIIKSKIMPNDKMKRQIEKTFQNLRLRREQYNVIHIRCGDDYLLHNKSMNIAKIEPMISALITFLKTSAEPCILLSDNTQIKKLLKLRFPRIIIQLNPIVHLGESIEQPDNSVMYTLIDFYIMSFSKKIISFSPYTWGSGFSEWCSIIYGIPYRKVII